MKDRHHLRTVNPPTTLPENDMARRGILLAAIGSLVDNEPGWADTDDMRSALLQSRTGDVAHAYLCAHVDIEGELMKVAATALAWLEAIQRERAR
jgi:hypothetical protein